ncbi:flagellar biosynthesis anti-sigma factor FlgM [archaeon]|nr:flagellar biosynthesis anti-sigma factor FlgM [archaeon]
MSIDKLSNTNVTNLYKPTTNKSDQIKNEPKKTVTSNTDAENRAARITELANQIKNNTFKVNADAIASKMLQDKDIVKHLLS